jgi:hypothetical protein
MSGKMIPISVTPTASTEAEYSRPA